MIELIVDKSCRKTIPVRLTAKPKEEGETSNNNNNTIVRDVIMNRNPTEIKLNKVKAQFSHV